MTKLLLIKTSSLGDVIHALPAISDLRSLENATRVDWVVEESLAAIALLHPGVDNVIRVAIRRWRRSLWQRPIRSEISIFRQHLRAQNYDAVVDAQGLFKSALIAVSARGPRHGLDFHSSREPLALFYHRTYRIGWDLHAVERTRLLCARALGYEVPQRCDYGLRAAPRSFTWMGGGAYAVLLHASSGDHKLWDERNWVALAESLGAAGTGCVLPWGNERERERAMRIAKNLRTAIVPPALSLEELAGLLAGAKMAVGVDTGLTHLAAALGAPTVGIYTATDPAATGIYGCARAINLGGIQCVPTVQQVLTALESVSA